MSEKQKEVIDSLIEKGFLLIVSPPICSSYFLFSDKLKIGAYVNIKGGVLYINPDIINEMTTSEKQKIIKQKIDEIGVLESDINIEVEKEGVNVKAL